MGGLFAVKRRVCTCGGKPGLEAQELHNRERKERKSAIYHVVVLSHHARVDIGLAADVLST